jgi:two-component system, OmpR family, alkaline phosphatase synthesis response regulator PhoP
MERVLIIDDDGAIRRALKRLFEYEGFGVDLAADGSAGLELFGKAMPSVLVLDLRLPGMSGEEVCREILRRAPGFPIVVLSAKTDIREKVLLLELGAYDYVTKPFSPRELLARVHAALRASKRVGPDQMFVFDDITVNFSAMEVTRCDHSVWLPAKAFQTLTFMIENRERVISREELLNKVWKYETYASTRTVDNHILKLRKSLERDPSNPLHFRTVHSAGYKFVP